MYRIEIFDQSMDYVSACYTDDAETISLDYLAFDPFQINIQPVAVKKGYFCHITKDNVTVADCIVSDVKPGKELQEISLRPLQALFDAEVFYNAVTDAIAWIGNNLTAQYINSTDTYQLRPLVITTTPGSRAFPLTGYNLNPTMNILSVITNAFRTWGVVTEASLDLVNKQILVNIFEQTATKTIECDLENVISSEVTLGDSYGSTNKLIVKKTVAEGSPTGTTEITYYRHNDGSISTTDTDRIVPVFWDVETLEQTEDMTDADWIAETETMAKETLTPAKYDNEVVIAVWEDDKIVNPKDIALGTITTLYIKGTTYYSILTGVTIEGNVYTLTFGAVRTELTKKLAIQSRSNGTSTGGSSGGGGGGGGGGDVTGVKGNAETVYRVGDVNITKANIGLGNVDNTSDANKPISTATQTALDNKVDKVTGKGLSTNDFTDALLSKLNGIESGAQVNTITGVKGNAESSYRTGNVNLTPANIGAVPTSRTVNGHALSANVTVTASDVGLGNVNNTSDLNKPISTATQTALNAKVNKTDIATTSNLGLVMPDGTSITIDADGTIHSVGGGGGGGGSSNIIDSLWTNSSPTTAFTAKTVSLSLSPYAFVFIKIREATTLAKYSWHIVAVGDSNTFTTYADYFIRARSVSASTSGVTFGSGLYYPRYAEDSPSTGDAQCVPVEIWGLRKVGGGSGSISYYESQTTSVASNAEILRITDSAITTNTIVLECTFANPSAISGDVSWTSYNGYISFTGTCTSATTANVTLADKTN